ncbi:hypothetical protein GCM10010405_17360 [Streptomyces macrosporus]|uniref:Aminoglycoside phosphotransferase domain-containing protein n=1 Tax=Streptomyces macrosporus TaxID=44032 RepID=A0ABN3JNL8_9ACTN
MLLRGHTNAVVRLTREPVVVDGHPVTFWTYLPRPDEPVPAQRIAGPLRALHQLPAPPFRLRPLDNVSAIRASLTAITTLSGESLRFLSQRVDRLEKHLADVSCELPRAVLQGDPSTATPCTTATGPCCATGTPWPGAGPNGT